MLVAEDLLLLLTDDDTGRLGAPSSEVDIALAGANLIELTMLEKIDLSGADDHGKSGRLVVRDASPTGDDVLDRALAAIHDRQGKRPSAALGPMSKGLRRVLYERLAAAGVVREQQGAILGIVPTHRWPARDVRHEAEVRRTLTDALVHGAAPEPRSAALISVAHALRREHLLVDGAQGLSKKELRTRAAEIAEGNWASSAVRTAINEMIAAVVVATVAASSATQ